MFNQTITIHTGLKFTIINVSKRLLPEDITAVDVGAFDTFQLLNRLSYKINLIIESLRIYFAPSEIKENIENSITEFQVIVKYGSLIC